MDRAIIYPGSIPLDTDQLFQGQYTKEALGRVLDSTFGQAVSSATGLAATPSTSALTVSIAPGIVNTWGEIDYTAIGGQGGGAPANGLGVTVQYLSDATQTVTIPGTGATYTIYALCSEVDTGTTVLPFYNASNPSQTQAGPGNTGEGLPTVRRASMTFVAATAQPTAPANGSVVALYTLAVPSGATSLSGVACVPLTPPFYDTIPQLQAQIVAQGPGRRLALPSVFGAGGSYAYQPPPGTQYLHVRGVGAGGAGGWAVGNGQSGYTAAGTGGAAGAEVEFWVSIANLPGGLANLTVAYGASPSSTSASSGNTGADTTFAGIVTLGGGQGGGTGSATNIPSAVAQASGGSVSWINSTIVDVIYAKTGASSSSGFTFQGSNWPAQGACSSFGTGGGNTSNGAGGSASGNGSGGAGAGSNGASAFPGGSGAPGMWIITPWS